MSCLVVRDKQIFLLGKKLLKLTWQMGKGSGKSSSNKIINEDEQQVAPCKKNVRVAYLKDKLKFKVLSTPERALKMWLYL